ncbi:anhydro-N-acetylmuramic acid kinase [Arthrospiribacter ruber]|uniref:Anhydro-N-acetylmuramic acid kinase n=1 Tax=Arthrospiribacter ruber TaxID=2487934 RepID=A0A951IYB1_9BACT|nr:anhydro-N-acetylmuramic acid kinase [Arthrospiribacter ruber]MBW3467673.1 anhydro-N-acetylmuramic acid kinase [Arthrospiribacter ruber]
MDQTYKVIGLMSGTSGDGLDIAYCHFTKSKDWSFNLEFGETVPFPENLGKSLQFAHDFDSLSLAQLDVDFGKWMGRQVRNLIDRKGWEVDVVCSHGHTVFHQPSKRLTLQIGNGWALHQEVGVPVINDFRMNDVQLGGQGAPLVPIGDRHLFGAYDYCINLGGIANISMEISGERKAFDICPFNLLLNRYAVSLGKSYDENGDFAREGKVLEDVLDRLNGLTYYKQPNAKSLGREDLDIYLEILENKLDHRPQDVLRTLVEHYIFQIMRVLSPESSKRKSVLVTGGGAFNMFFMQKLKEAMAGYFELIDAGKEMINFKEALIFGFLGVLRLRNEPNCLASVTGAKKDSCGGMLFGL